MQYKLISASGKPMRRMISRFFIATALFLACFAGPLQAETGKLKPAVLVLPLSPGADAPAEKTYLGLAAQNVIENMLLVHNELEANSLISHVKKLFPQERDFQSWMHSPGLAPTTITQIDLRYVITGRITPQGEKWSVNLELLDRTSGKKLNREFMLDLPGLQEFRKNFINLLEQAGVPAPASQKAKMLWGERLPLEAFARMGEGLYEDLSVTSYHAENAVYNLKPFEEGLRLSPRSYLLLNNLAWVVYRQKKVPEAIKLFEQALTVNPYGADAADGMERCAIQMGDEALAETWVAKKAEIYGKDVKLARANFWNSRGIVAYKKEDYVRAIESFRKAVTFNPAEVVHVTNLAGTYEKMGKFDEGQNVLEGALKSTSASEDQKKLQIALADLHFSWAQRLKEKKELRGCDPALSSGV